MGVIRALDASAYTGEIPPSVWPILKGQNGVTHHIPQLHGGGPSGTGPNLHLRQHVEGARAAGIVVEMGYVWPCTQWHLALTHWRDQVGGQPKVLWLDVESGSLPSISEVAAIRGMGIIPGIYTSQYFWQRDMIARPDYWWYAQNKVPLWAAYYPNDGRPWPEQVNPAYLPIPWRQYPQDVVGWQWAGTTYLQSEGFDMSVFKQEWVDSWTAPRTEDEMASSEYNELMGRINQLENAIRNHGHTAGTPPPPPPAPPRRTYTVVAGDTLSGIAQKVYGNAGAWQKIYDANRGIIGGNPNLIRAGQVLTIP